MFMKIWERYEKVIVIVKTYEKVKESTEKRRLRKDLNLYEAYRHA